MARRLAIPSKEAQLKIVGPIHALVIPRVQRLSFTADRPSTDVDELGNRLHAGTVEDLPAVTAFLDSLALVNERSIAHSINGFDGVEVRVDCDEFSPDALDMY